jgi:hypothetical protein
VTVWNGNAQYNGVGGLSGYGRQNHRVAPSLPGSSGLRTIVQQINDVGTSLEVNSVSILIRDSLFNRIKAIPFFASVARFGRSRMRVIQGEHIPYLGCYLVKERLTPDGDSNHAEPRFVHTMTLGFSYVIQNNDDDRVENFLDRAYWEIMNYLRRQDWHTFAVGVGIESITGGDRRHEYGNVTRDNETPIAEMRLELTMVYRSLWPPIVEDDLETIHVTTRYPWDEDPNKRIPVIVEYDLPQN